MSMAGRMLTDARQRANLTQRQLAAKTGIPQETIARIERGRVDPRVGTLDRLLEGCGYGLESMPRLGIGVDRTQIRELPEADPVGATGVWRWPTTAHFVEFRRDVQASRRMSELARFRPEVDPRVADRPRRPVRHRRRPGRPGPRLAVADSGPGHLLRPRPRQPATTRRRRSTELAAVRRGLPPDAPRDAAAGRSDPARWRALHALDVGGRLRPPGGRRTQVSTTSACDAGAVTATVAGRAVADRVARRPDAMKRAAGRPKDRIELEILGALREELDRWRHQGCRSSVGRSASVLSARIARLEQAIACSGPGRAGRRASRAGRGATRCSQWSVISGPVGGGLESVLVAEPPERATFLLVDEPRRRVRQP